MGFNPFVFLMKNRSELQIGFEAPERGLYFQDGVVNVPKFVLTWVLITGADKVNTFFFIIFDNQRFSFPYHISDCTGGLAEGDFVAARNSFVSFSCAADAFPYIIGFLDALFLDKADFMVMRSSSNRADSLLFIDCSLILLPSLSTYIQGWQPIQTCLSITSMKSQIPTNLPPGSITH